MDPSYSHVFTIVTFLSRFAAKFTVDVRGYTVDEEDMVCLQLKVDFLPKFPHLW